MTKEERRATLMALNYAHQAAQLMKPARQLEIRRIMLAIRELVKETDPRIGELSLAMALAMFKLEL